jgi:hypothetical protein
VFDRLKQKLHDAMTPKPGTALSEVEFAEAPHIVKRGGRHVLRYRVRGQKGERLPLKMPLLARAGEDKGYYYFSMPVSSREPGNLVERSLADDGLEEFARQNAVYWLNPDGSEVPLEIREE